jgi:hypothetical protein
VQDADGETLTYHWQLTQDSEFDSDSVLYDESTTNNQLSVNYATLDSVVTALGIENGQTVGLQHRIVVDDGSIQHASDTMFTYFRNGTITSLTESNVEQPDKHKLRQNYPNPFNPTTTIQYSIPGKAHVKLSVYNTLGQQVAVLVDRTMGAGSYKTTWNAENQNSGMYLYRIEAGEFTDTKSMILLK